VAIPTETVHGLAGNIYSEKPFKKIFETKKDPYLILNCTHCSTDKLKEIVSEIPEKAHNCRCSCSGSIGKKKNAYS
jgi:L-threonylcarbamoyladenylate synthase